MRGLGDGPRASVHTRTARNSALTISDRIFQGVRRNRASTCRKCQAPIEATGKPGRPRSYCSVGCRRASEYEIRRADRAVESMEERARWARINNFEAKQYDAERLRLEARLRLLLDDEDVKA